MTREQDIELLRSAAAKLRGVGLYDAGTELRTEADRLEENPDVSLSSTDIRLYFARTVNDYIAFCRMVGAITQ